MSTLSDADIRHYLDSGELVIDPLDESNIEPSSVDFRLGGEFIRYRHHDSDGGPIDTVDEETLKGRGEEIISDSLVIHPGDFVLGTTMETVELPSFIQGEMKGRSTTGRLGLVVHKTAGLIDPGYRGEITMEMTVDAPNPVRVHEGQRIAQMVFRRMESPAEEPYGHGGSQYQGQSGATESGMDFD